MMNTRGKSGHPGLVADFRGKASAFFTVDYDAIGGLVAYGLYYVEVHSLYTLFVEVL